MPSSPNLLKLSETLPLFATLLVFSQLATAQETPPPPAQLTPAQLVIQNSANLPFDMPPLETLRKSPKKVFAHWFSPFPLTLDNKEAEADYYTRGFLSLDGEKSKHAPYGGYFRERPLPQKPYPAGVDWKLASCEDDVRRAIALGIDGFTVDMLATDGRHMDYMRLLFKAAENVDPDFKLVLMPDAISLKTKMDTLAGAVKELGASPNAYRLDDGRLVIAPYYAQGQTPEWWKNWMDEMKAGGMPIAFVPLFHAWRDNIAAYAPISAGASDWGPRSVAAFQSNIWKNATRDAHAHVKIWMTPVAPQDVRPRSASFWEASNSATYRASWENAIGVGGMESADWVQIITWNDYSENAQISPSTGIQWSFYDLSAFYTAWFKTGNQPAIKRDVIYYFHRQHATSAIPAKQAKIGEVRAGDPVSNDIEALVFVTSPATLEIEIAGRKTTHPIAAPMTSVRIPLVEGRPKFRLLRMGKVVAQVESAFPISNAIDFQDFTYHGGSSSRAPVSPVKGALYPKF